MKRTFGFLSALWGGVYGEECAGQRKEGFHENEVRGEGCILQPHRSLRVAAWFWSFARRIGMWMTLTRDRVYDRRVLRFSL